MPERESDASRESEFRSDYDGAWKAGFKEHLREFMSDFFPVLAELVDWSGAPQWQDRELEQLLARLKRRNTAVDGIDRGTAVAARGRGHSAQIQRNGAADGDGAARGACARSIVYR